MGRLEDLPIGHKLRAVVLIVSGLAVAGACAAYLAYDWVASKRELSRRLETLARIVGEQSTPALEFQQKTQAAAILASLRAERPIVAAALFDARGVLFASYLREGTEARALPSGPGADGRREEGADLAAVASLESGGERVGALWVRCDLSEVRGRLGIGLLTSALILLAAAGVVSWLSSRLGRVVTDPVQRLASVVQAVAERRDYAVRVEGKGRDELGRLIEGFNHMLSQIQVRDEALDRARDELERRVQERTRDLEAANRELEGFSYSVSHDLRAPLRAIDGFSKMLMEDCGPKVDGPGRRYIDVIQQSTRRMGQLIDDLLDFARMGRKPVSRERVEIGRMAREVLTELTQAHPDRSFETRIGDLPDVVGDPSMLRQVVVNLLSNAVKYSRDRRPAVIEVGGETSGDEIVFTVKDNGAGFDMTYAKKLFGVFQRLHSASEFEGTGVGLAFVQRIIQRHGGRVWGEGKVGEGAVFRFTLPRA